MLTLHAYLTIYLKSYVQLSNGLINCYHTTVLLYTYICKVYDYILHIVYFVLCIKNYVTFY
jgi:hypothetical protein